MPQSDEHWPPIPGDFAVKDPECCLAICTLGKKIEVPSDYAIIGTCKTENIGIERVIINIISNPKIRYFILAGPEIPGHLTGRTMKCMYENGVDEKTRKIIEAPGAIPYIENVPLEGVERFRAQVELIDMINISNPAVIAEKAVELLSNDPGAFPDDPIWVDFGISSKPARKLGMGASVAVLPEMGISLDTSSSLLAKEDLVAHVSAHPSSVGIEIQSSDNGTMLLGKELR